MSRREVPSHSKDEPFWEYLLLADEFERGLTRARRSRRRRWTSGVAGRSYADLEAFTDAVAADMEFVGAAIERTKEQFRAGRVKLDNGDAISALAALIADDLYTDLLQVALELRGAKGSTGVENFCSLLADLIADLMDQVESFLSEASREIRAKVAMASPGDELGLALTLSIEVNPTLAAQAHIAMMDALLSGVTDQLAGVTDQVEQLNASMTEMNALLDGDDLDGPREAELMAAAWMRAHGYPDAVATAVGPDDGIDVVATGAVAQVKHHAGPVGIRDVQRHFGAALGRTALFFAYSGYTAQAVRWADSAGIALFTYHDGQVEPANGPASAMSSPE